MAIIQTLRRTILPVRIHTDHWPIVKGLRQGRAWAHRAGRKNLDLWREMWFIISDLGGLTQDLEIECVLGHDDGGHDEARGNRWADAMARNGASIHEIDAATLKEAEEQDACSTAT